MKSLRNSALLLFYTGVSFLFAGALLIWLTGCASTIIPIHTESSQPSFDPSGQQNSGFLGWETNAGEVYGVLTLDAVARYTTMLAIYGKDFTPPLTGDHPGLIEENANRWLIDKQHLVDFETMNRWKKEGKKP